MAHEFSVRGNLLEILRVFERLIIFCVLVCYEYIEDCLKKDGVFFRKNEELVVLKRSLSRQKTSSFSEKMAFFHLRQTSYHFESAILHENHPKTRKNFTDSFVLHSHHIAKKME